MGEVKPDIETIAKIKVVGIGGSGSSAVNRMVEAKIRGVEFVAMNTDVQALHCTKASHKLHIGRAVTRGLTTWQVLRFPAVNNRGMGKR